MKDDLKCTHVTPAGGNVFSDLGFEREEAEALKAHSQRVISERSSIKKHLMHELASWIEANSLKQTQAADLLGVTRPRVSDLVHEKDSKFTIDSLVDMLARAGKRVQLSVQ